MQINKTIVTYFSPTHTGAKVAEAVALGTAPLHGLTTIDASHTLPERSTFSDDEVTVVCAPVYGGHVAPLAIERLSRLHGQGTPAVAIVIYGNRNFGTAATELCDFLRGQGFIPVATAAFVGEHSYSTPETPIAPGRPSASDLQEAKKFGEEVKRALQHGIPKAIDASRLKCPASGWLNVARFIFFVLRYRHAAKRRVETPILPAVDTKKCKSCGKCVSLCPAAAIPVSDPTQTDPKRCIRCAACVKGCALGARTLNTPFAPVLSRNFRKEKRNVWLVAK